MSRLRDLHTTRAEVLIIAKIAARAVKMAERIGVPYLHMDAMMDIEYAHAGCPLRLAALLESDDGTFGHDVFGIRRHMNRTTGELGGCFMPRMAVQS